MFEMDGTVIFRRVDRRHGSWVFGVWVNAGGGAVWHHGCMVDMLAFGEEMYKEVKDGKMRFCDFLWEPWFEGWVLRLCEPIVNGSHGGSAGVWAGGAMEDEKGEGRVDKRRCDPTPADATWHWKRMFQIVP
ncbi:uncharacterized protein SPSK_05679 [Sporothrix schenckii 1099-18]|uniref:Uncharacterized protein n=1 Tax=Sporothrix schenckii 1099-18 TaxID=1397361 RepID=A0A0F2LUK7_SPOSC|nr:uncharacterized protein SPSK_05679 [Sporothrix schenckii 1099-18]KJR80519.1 hypothetical protein SPSK_05679 [Sporothrix schenckii 1099-18]